MVVKYLAIVTLHTFNVERGHVQCSLLFYYVLLRLQMLVYTPNNLLSPFLLPLSPLPQPFPSPFYIHHFVSLSQSSWNQEWTWRVGSSQPVLCLHYRSWWFWREEAIWCPQGNPTWSCDLCHVITKLSMCVSCRYSRYKQYYIFYLARQLLYYWYDVSG